MGNCEGLSIRAQCARGLGRLAPGGRTNSATGAFPATRRRRRSAETLQPAHEVGERVSPTQQSDRSQLACESRSCHEMRDSTRHPVRRPRQANDPRESTPPTGTKPHVSTYSPAGPPAAQGPCQSPASSCYSSRLLCPSRTSLSRTLAPGGNVGPLEARTSFRTIRYGENRWVRIPTAA